MLKDNIMISGFSDEISNDLDIQISTTKQIGMNYICLRGINGKNIGEYSFYEFERDIYFNYIKNKVLISSIGSPVGKVDIDDENGFQEHLLKLDEMCKIANLCNSKYVRVFSFFTKNIPNPNDYKDKVIAKLNEFVNIAKKYNIVLIHENEKDIFGDTLDRCLFIMNQVNSDNFKMAFDFANFVQCGEDTINCYNKLKNHIAYIHIKDAVSNDSQNVPCGTGEGKINEILKKAIKEDNYNGFLTLEPHLVIFDSLKDLELDDVSEIIKNDIGLTSEEAYKLQYHNLNKILEDICNE